MMITLMLSPHIENEGFHTNRFDAYLDGKLLVTSRQPRLDGARKLLEMGYPPDTLLNTRHEGKAYDSWTTAKPIGELARWTTEESDKGLRRREWKPYLPLAA